MRRYNFKYLLSKIKCLLLGIYKQIKGEDETKIYLSYHIGLLSDKVRTTLIRKAIFEKVKDGSTIVDIGTGSGILALFACQAGAKKVYAIEKSCIINVAKKLAKDNGFENKIVFINEDSMLVKLPERVDGIISEIIGSVGLEENILPTLYDAKKRFLKKEGFFIPKGLQYYIAPVYLRESDNAEIVNFFIAKQWNLNFKSIIKNNRCKVLYLLIPQFKDFELLGEPTVLGNIEFEKINYDIFNSSAKLHISKNGILSGFIVYLKIYFSDNIALCPFIQKEQISWSSWCTFLFFPSTKLIQVQQGQPIQANICYSTKHGWDLRFF